MLLSAPEAGYGAESQLAGDEHGGGYEKYGPGTVEPLGSIEPKNGRGVRPIKQKGDVGSLSR